MKEGLVLFANFVGVRRPVIAIMSPKAKQKVSSAEFTATGKAKDNAGVSMVWYQFNSSGWNQAITTNNWTTWMTQPLSLQPGANVIHAVAEDAAQNLSLTHTVKFYYP